MNDDSITDEAMKVAMEYMNNQFKRAPDMRMDTISNTAKDAATQLGVTLVEIKYDVPMFAYSVVVSKEYHYGVVQFELKFSDYFVMSQPKLHNSVLRAFHDKFLGYETTDAHVMKQWVSTPSVGSSTENY